MVQELSQKRAPGIQPKKGMTLGVYAYIWRGMGHGMLFSRILLDLVGTKTSGQKGTDSIKCEQVQGSAFCDKHIKIPSPVFNSAWSATVLAKDLEILLHLDSSLRLLAKRPRELQVRYERRRRTYFSRCPAGTGLTCRALLGLCVLSWRRSRRCETSFTGKG